MIIHQREIGYGEDYSRFFEALVKAKAYMEQKYSEVSVDLMYNLAGQRGRATIQTRYPSLAYYERIDAEMIMYYNEPNNDGNTSLNRLTSTDGMNWSAPQTVITMTNYVMSPA